MKQQLLDAGLGLTEADFDNHASDLYVRAKPGVAEWLREQGERFSYFTHQQHGDQWIEIPFKNEQFWIDKCGRP